MTEIITSETPTTSSWWQKWLGREKLTEIEVIFFGLAIVLGNRNFFWNQGLVYGYEAVAVNTLFVGSAFFCLCLCMGEMSSALPFSGGIFGFVRAATGPYYGFVVACFEVIFCLANLVVIVRFCVYIPVLTGIVERPFTPYLIVLNYGVILIINLLGGKPFWSLIVVIAFITLLFLIIFLFGTLADVDKSRVSFEDYCKTDISVTFEALMKDRWLTVSQFQGLQYLPLLSEYVAEPRKTIPRAMVLCATELVCFSIFITLAACSTYPGQAILQQTLVPLIYGYKDIFKIDLIDAIWLHLPGLFAPTLATLYCSGRQLCMIAKSGMLPKFFATSTPHTGTPAVALIFATSAGIAIDLATYYNPDVLYHIINISLISSHIIFINAFIAYFFFIQKYTSLPRSFRNPFGIWGAIYGLINNLIGCISVILYNSNDNVSYSLYVMVGYFVIVTLLYFLYLGKRQIFSAEEKKLMFKAYLINANRDKQRRIFRGNNKGPKTPITRKPSTRALYEEAPSDMQNENGLEDPTTHLSRRGVEQRSENSVSTSRHDQSSVRNAVAYAGKVLHDLGTKMSVVVPVTSDELTEYQQLIILSAGGAIDPSEEVALQESLGIHDNEIEKEDDKDIESSSFIFEASL